MPKKGKGKDKKMLNINRYIGFKYLKGNSSLVFSTRFYSTALNNLQNGDIKSENNISRYTRGGLNKQILQLNEQLAKRLDQSGNLSESYRIFNDLILEFEAKYNKPQLVSSGQSVFNYTRYLNTTLTKLFKQSLSQGDLQIDPYQLLNDYCIHHLARPNHFLTLMKQYLMEQKYQDVLSLWVKYLDSIPSFKVEQFQYIHKEIQIYAMIAYLSLNGEQFTPDLKYLLAFLNLEDIDIVKLYEKIRSSNFINNNQFIWNNFDLISKQYLQVYIENFEKEIMHSINVSKLESMYKIYERSVTDDIKPNIDVLINFIKRFLSLQYAPLAMKVFDTFKDRIVDPKDRLAFTNQLLYIVSQLSGGKNSTTATKSQMIQAVWNTYFKMEYFQKPIPIESYCSLFESLTSAKEFRVLESIWNHELSSDVKSNSTMKQCYLSCLLKDKKQEMTHENMVERLEKESMVNYPELIKTVLLRTILDPKTKHEQFVEIWNKHKQVIESKIDPEFIAIEILSNYRYSTNKDEFNFMEALNNNNNNYNQCKPLIIESFVKIVPTIHPLRKMYHQLKKHENDPSVIRMFIEAEFKKTSGDVTVADSMVKDYIFTITSKSRNYSKLHLEDKLKIKMVLDSFITLCSRHNNKNEDIDIILKYMAITNQLSITLQNSTIYHVILLLRKLDVERLPIITQENIKDFLESIMSKKIRFKLSGGDIKKFREKGLLK